MDLSAAGQASPNTSRALKLGRKKWGAGDIKRHVAYMMMLIPGISFLLVFSYMPLPGILLAFKNFKLAIPPKDFWLQNRYLYSLFYNSNWAGLKNFQFIFTSAEFPIFMRNTLGYNLLFMCVGLFFAISIAVGINELKQRLHAKLYHTVIFMPYFLSWIIVTYLLYAFISSTGIINNVLAAAGMEKIDLYSKVNAWPFIFLIANIWRYAGNGSIIYLATITGFSQELYEAAAIDGAGKWKQFRFITFPQLVPTIVLLQILAIGRILNGDFDMFYTLPNGSGMLRNASLVIDVYVYNTLRTATNLSLPAAAAFFQSTVGFFLVLITNGIVRKVQPDMAMF